MDYENIIMSPLDLTVAKWDTPNKAVENIEETKTEIEYLAIKFFNQEIAKLDFTDIKSKKIISIVNLGEKGVYKVIGHIKGNLADLEGDNFTLSFIMKKQEEKCSDM